MPNILASIQYNTSVNKILLRAYKVSMSDTDLTPTDRLCQHGPVYNNIVTDTGVFSTLQDAVRAILGYVDVPCSLLQTDGATLHLVTPGKHSVALAKRLGATLLGRRSRRGTWIREVVPAAELEDA
jgi:hypothetical protein